MRPRLDIAIGRWLAAERDGRDGDAEGSLAGIFGTLPLATPPAAFADRVLLGVGLSRPVAVYPLWSRVAIAACLLLAGLALSYILPLVLGLSRWVGPGEMVAATVRAFVGLVSRVDEVLALCQVVAKIVQTSMMVATAPPVVLTLLALSVLATFTFRALSDLVSPRRSSEYVQAF